MPSMTTALEQRAASRVAPIGLLFLVTTRYDKLAANYLAFVQLAFIRLWRRVNESTS
jgi:transposase